MRSSSVLVAALVLLLSGAASADLRVFEATLSLEGITPPPPPLTTAVGVATVNGSGDGAHVSSLFIPPKLMGFSTTFPVAASTMVPFTQVQLGAAVGSGMLAVGGDGVLAGPMALDGHVRLCVLGCTSLTVNAPLLSSGGNGLGLGGTVMGPVGPIGALTLGGGVWRTGMASIPTSSGVVARTGFAHGPLSGTSSTAQPQGALQLVTPIAVRFSEAPGLVVPVFGVLDVKFLPEPGTGALFGSGAALLMLLGARRARRHTR
jgi:hypothetical protein